MVEFRKTDGGFESPLDGFIYDTRGKGISPDKVTIVVTLVRDATTKPEMYECAYQAYHHDVFIRDSLVSLQPDAQLLEDFLKEEALVAEREHITLEILR